MGFVRNGFHMISKRFRFAFTSKDDLACRIIEIENRKDIREQQANKGKQWANRLYARQKDETHELLNIIFNE